MMTAGATAATLASRHVQIGGREPRVDGDKPEGFRYEGGLGIRRRRLLAGRR
jgi:hypothetical protein